MPLLGAIGPVGWGASARLLLGSVTLGLLMMPARQASAQACGPLTNAFGPFDYRKDHYVASPGDSQPWSEKLSLVERGHFTVVVQQLTRGESAALPGLDLDYTLRAFPNHHRALATVLKAWERSKTPSPVGLPRPAECYFERAIRFRPNDNISRLLYASFLIKASRRPEAITHLTYVEQNAGDNAFTHFNLGMVYADAAMSEEALRHAHKALALGFAQRDLITRLQAAGHWREPSAGSSPQPLPAAVAGAASGASAPSN
jgi:tetratricopeptide (TPR) repeat protein